jgi:hypothetical protein
MGRRTILIGVAVVILSIVGAALALGGDDAEKPVKPSSSTTERKAAAGSTTTSPLPASADQAEITSVRVRKACVQPGERQTIVIEGAPDTQLIYQALYPDGKVGFEPDYPGGNEQAQISPDGTLKRSWVVGKKATSGTVKVDVYDVFNTASIGGAAASTTFEIPPKSASCAESDE